MLTKSMCSIFSLAEYTCDVRKCEKFDGLQRKSLRIIKFRALREPALDTGPPEGPSVRILSRQNHGLYPHGHAIAPPCVSLARVKLSPANFCPYWGMHGHRDWRARPPKNLANRKKTSQQTCATDFIERGMRVHGMHACRLETEPMPGFQSRNRRIRPSKKQQECQLCRLRACLSGRRCIMIVRLR